jgi:hypothetical protein
VGLGTHWHRERLQSVEATEVIEPAGETETPPITTKKGSNNLGGGGRGNHLRFPHH